MWALALALLLLSGQAEAQRVQPTGVLPAPSVQSQASAEPDEADDTRWRLDRCLLGLGYHSVTKVSVAAAGGLRRAFEPRSVCLYGAAHLGLGGMRSELGTAVTIGRFASALGVSGGLLRTFGSPAGDALPWRTYAGGSVHLWPLLGIHTEFGAYQRLGDAGLAAGDGAARRLFVWAVGFGY
jgi:hypothetical protein